MLIYFLFLHYATVHIFTLAVYTCYELMNLGLRPDIENAVLILSAPEILQRPAPKPGAPLFGAPRP